MAPGSMGCRRAQARGSWKAAVNGSTSDGYVYQRVAATAGWNYTFSAWVTTWPRENNTWKYGRVAGPQPADPYAAGH